MTRTCKYPVFMSHRHDKGFLLFSLQFTDTAIYGTADK